MNIKDKRKITTDKITESNNNALSFFIKLIVDIIIFINNNIPKSNHVDCTNNNDLSIKTHSLLGPILIGISLNNGKYEYKINKLNVKPTTIFNITPTVS